MLNIRKFFVDLIGLKYYTSELDQFLTHYRKTNPLLSASQQQEKAKYTRVFAFRDNSNSQSSQPIFWSKF